MTIFASLTGLTLNYPLPSPTLPPPSLRTTCPVSLAILIGKSEETGACSFLLPTSDQLFVVESLPFHGRFQPGQLGHLKFDGKETIFIPLTDEDHSSLVRRGQFSFSRSAYSKFVLPALLLASRVREYQQSSATVLNVNPLILSAPSRPGILSKITCCAETGERIELDVSGIRRDSASKTMKIFVTKNFPSSIEKGSCLQIQSEIERTPFVTQALEMFHSGKRPIMSHHLFDRIYGKPWSFSYPLADETIVTIRRYDGSLFDLNVEQSAVVHYYQQPASFLPIIGIESPPGSGKTRTAAVMAVTYCKGGLQVFSSTANQPVYNLADTLATLDYGNKKILHLLSADREARAERLSPFSIHANNESEHSRLFKELREEWKRASKKEKWEILKEMRVEHAATMEEIEEDYDVLLGTEDMILAYLLKKKDSSKPCPIQKQLETRVTRVVFDESSQLTEAGMNAALLLFPHAQHVYFGDSNQMEPFKYVRGEDISEMGACSALDVIKRKGIIPVIKLLHTYRQTDDLMPHNEMFYEGLLVSSKPPSQRVLLAPIFNVTRDCVFMEVKDAKTEQSGTSKINHDEITALEYAIEKLEEAGYDSQSIMIIAYYEAQRKLAARLLPGYDVLTVDSAQGREKDIAIVLTTRDAPTTAPFFTCTKRCNVSISRQKEALIVIGSDALLKTDPWRPLLNGRYFSTFSFGQQSVGSHGGDPTLADRLDDVRLLVDSTSSDLAGVLRRRSPILLSTTRIYQLILHRLLLHTTYANLCNLTGYFICLVSLGLVVKHVFGNFLE